MKCSTIAIAICAAALSVSAASAQNAAESAAKPSTSPAAAAANAQAAAQRLGASFTRVSELGQRIVDNKHGTAYRERRLVMEDG